MNVKLLALCLPLTFKNVTFFFLFLGIRLEGGLVQEVFSKHCQAGQAKGQMEIPIGIAPAGEAGSASC